MSAMGEDKKKDPDSNDSSSPLENQEEIDEWLEARQDPITRMWMATERYLEKLGNADWNEIDKIRKNQDWAEAKHQVKLIWHRIHELGDEASLDANRERVFRKT